MAGIRFNFQTRGLKEIETRLASLGEAGPIKQAMARRVQAEMKEIISQSQLLVPRDTGFLAQSAFTETPEVLGDRIEVTGGYAAEYAVYVHEDLSAFHDDGVARFLAIPYEQWERGALKRFGEDLRASRAVTVALQRVGGFRG